MTEDQRMILGPVLALLRTACHRSDSAVLVAHQVPNWQAAFQSALNDPTRVANTNRKLEPLARLEALFGEAVLDSEQWLEAIGELQYFQFD